MGIASIRDKGHVNALLKDIKCPEKRSITIFFNCKVEHHTYDTL